MLRISSLHALAFSLACLAGLRLSHAAEPGGAPAVEVVGTGTLERAPDQMRMRIELTAKGANMREALEKLKDRGEAARVQLLSLGATKDSIQLGEPALSQANNQQRQMEMMIQQRLSQARKSKKKPEVTSVRVSTTLAAAWPLSSPTPAEALITASELRDKIVEMDLAGTKEVQKLSPEEQELAEEMEQMAQQYASGDQSQPGMPVFFYALKLTPDEQNKLLADAYADAERKARQLAAATNKKLGGLQRLASSASNQAANSPAMMRRWQMYYGMQGDPYGMGSESASDGNEVLSDKPGKVTHAVSVSASFALE